VVALAVEGLSNPEIATRLYMSRGTVKTHLAHIYTKLNIANRTELATQAATRPVPTDRINPPNYGRPPPG
jgi:DNA-binding NarL/FixJ family response regulator